MAAEVPGLGGKDQKQARAATRWGGKKLIMNISKFQKAFSISKLSLSFFGSKDAAI